MRVRTGEGFCNAVDGAFADAQASPKQFTEPPTMKLECGLSCSLCLGSKPPPLGVYKEIGTDRTTALTGPMALFLLLQSMVSADYSDDGFDVRAVKVDYAYPLCLPASRLQLPLQEPLPRPPSFQQESSRPRKLFLAFLSGQGTWNPNSVRCGKDLSPLLKLKYQL